MWSTIVGADFWRRQVLATLFEYFIKAGFQTTMRQTMKAEFHSCLVNFHKKYVFVEYSNNFDQHCWLGSPNKLINCVGSCLYECPIPSMAPMQSNVIECFDEKCNAMHSINNAWIQHSVMSSKDDWLCWLSSQWEPHPCLAVTSSYIEQHQERAAVQCNTTQRFAVECKILQNHSKQCNVR